MVELSLKESRRPAPPAASTSVESPGDPAPAQLSGPGLTVRTAEQAFVDSTRSELDGYFVGLKQLSRMPGEEVFVWLSGVSARLCELRIYLWRSESRRLAALRSREVDPLIEEIDRQFKFHSRLVAERQLEWDHSKGQI